MKRKIKPKLKHTENIKLKAVINEASDKLRGVDNFIPPTYEETMNGMPLPISSPGRAFGAFNDANDSSITRQPFIFTDRFIDNSLAISFFGCVTCLGILIGLNLK